MLLPLLPQVCKWMSWVFMYTLMNLTGQWLVKVHRTGFICGHSCLLSGVGVILSNWLTRLPWGQTKRAAVCCKERWGERAFVPLSACSLQGPWLRWAGFVNVYPRFGLSGRVPHG